MSETVQVTGRIRKPAELKADRTWWFQNDDEQRVTEATWYMPGQPEWERELFWNLRNPAQNFRAYVIGVQDLNYSVTGRAPAMTIQRDDMRPIQFGWQWAFLHGGDLKWPLPFLSYSGRRFGFQLGWQPNGFFIGAKIYIHKEAING